MLAVVAGYLRLVSGLSRLPFPHLLHGNNSNSDLKGMELKGNNRHESISQQVVQGRTIQYKVLMKHVTVIITIIMVTRTFLSV